MNTSIKKLSDELNAINAKRAEVEEQLKSIMTDVIEEAGKTNAHGIKKLGGKSFSVSSRELVGHTWSPTYYDWEQAVEPLVAYLEKKPATEWKSALQELLDKSVYGQVRIESTKYYNGNRVKTDTVVDSEFIRSIIEKL